MPYAVYLQYKRTGHSMAHVLDLPGCIAQGATPDECLARVPASMARYLDWLRRCGEPAPPQDEPIAIEVVERNPSTIHTGLIGFYAAERVPVTDAEIARFLRLMSHSRQRLLRLVQDVTPAMLASKPRRAAWTLEEVLRHVANAERWYLTRLWGRKVRSFPPQPDVFQRLAIVRAEAVRRLSSLSARDRARIVTRDDELWSARKVFRRFLEHEAEHTEEIAVERLGKSEW